MINKYPLFRYTDNIVYPVLFVDFVNDCFDILPEAELEGGNTLSIHDISQIIWDDCVHCLSNEPENRKIYLFFYNKITKNWDVVREIKDPRDSEDWYTVYSSTHPSMIFTLSHKTPGFPPDIGVN